MGAEQAEGAPALVYIRRGLAFKAADVVAPEAEAGGAQAQAAPQAFLHRLVVRPAVAAPVYRELLPAGGGRAGKEDGLLFALFGADYIMDGLVVEIGVVVVHLHRVGAVEYFLTICQFKRGCTGGPLEDT